MERRETISAKPRKAGRRTAVQISVFRRRRAAESRNRESQFLRRDKAQSAAGMQVAARPRARPIRAADERASVIAAEMETVAAEARMEINMFGHAAVFADGVMRLIEPLDDGKQAEHDALIAYAVQVIELRRQIFVVNRARFALAQVAHIAALPEGDLVIRPRRALHEAVALVVAAAAAVPWGRRQTRANGKYPFLAEGVVEKRRIVATEPRRHRVAKVHAVRADGHLRHVALRRSEIVEHLIAFLRMLGLLIEPHAGTVPLPAGLWHKNAVGAHLIIQHLPRKMPPVG